MIERDFINPGKSVALAANGMAATSHPQATLAALDILRAGGNAVDAAICAVAVQSVVEPHMTGIGGDCFAIYSPAGSAPVCLNGSGRAPAAATLEHYLERGQTAIADDSVDAVTVPGAIDAWCRLLERHGRLGIDRVLAPAIDAAENGFRITPRVAHDWTVDMPRICALSRRGRALSARTASRRAPATACAIRRWRKRSGGLPVMARRRSMKARSPPTWLPACANSAVCIRRRTSPQPESTFGRRFRHATATTTCSNARPTDRVSRR